VRFPNPVAVTCLTCGQPTVVTETSIGSVQVRCGSWRWQCDIPATGALYTDRFAVTPAGLIPLDAASDQKLAA